MNTYAKFATSYPLDDNKKVSIAKEFLERYKRQEAVSRWQEERLKTVEDMVTIGSPSSEGERVQASIISDPTADTAIKIIEIKEKAAGRLMEEQAHLIEIYSEITDALSLLQDESEREILYDIYIKGYMVAAAYKLWGIHPRTASRRHRQALIALYDAMVEQAKTSA